MRKLFPGTALRLMHTPEDILFVTVLKIGVAGVAAVPLRPEVSTVAFSYPLTWTVTSVLFIIYYVKGKWLKRCRRMES